MLQSERKAHAAALQIEKQNVLKDQESTTQAMKVQLDESIKTLRNQLDEKDKEIAMIKRMWEEGKENSTKEQKLMISAFYGVGLELARLKVPQPNVPSGISAPTAATPRAFLAKLRNDHEQNENIIFK